MSIRYLVMVCLSTALITEAPESPGDVRPMSEMVTCAKGVERYSFASACLDEDEDMFSNIAQITCIWASDMASLVLSLATLRWSVYSRERFARERYIGN